MKSTSMANQLRMKVRAPRGATMVVNVEVAEAVSWIDRITLALFPRRLPAGTYRLQAIAAVTQSHNRSIAQYLRPKKCINVTNKNMSMNQDCPQVFLEGT
jgi:hypothetical protein